MEKILFETESEAKNFIKQNMTSQNDGKSVNSSLEDILTNLKENGYIKESLIKKAEEQYNNYKFKKKNFINRADVERFLKEDEKLADLLYSALQFIKKKLADLEETLSVQAIEEEEE